MSDSRILWRTNRKLAGLVIDAPISQKAGALRNKFESCRARQLRRIHDVLRSATPGYAGRNSVS
jgi:hypothetical protein